MTDFISESVLRALDRLQFEASVEGDDAEWERLAAIRTEVNCARAGDGE
jgi:hypothetical protein